MKDMQIAKALGRGALAWFATLMVLQGVLAAFSFIPAFIVGFLVIRANWPSQDDERLPVEERRRLVNLYLKRLLLEGTVTGFVTGLFEGLATSGDDLSGGGAIFAFLVVPGITAALLFLLFWNTHLLSGKRLFARLLSVTYVTTVPLFGFLAGGANVPQVALAGACFGTALALFAMLVLRYETDLID